MRLCAEGERIQGWREEQREGERGRWGERGGRERARARVSEGEREKLGECKYVFECGI